MDKMNPLTIGMDMALMLAEKIAGTEFAMRLQLGLEYDPKPPFDCGSPLKAPKTIVNGLQARLKMVFEE